MEKITVLLVDDHQLFREGLSLLLGNMSNISEIIEANNSESFFVQLKIKQPDIIFMDIDMPGGDGIDATKKALALFPDLNIIALSMYDDEDYYTRMINAGAKGFILKNSGIKEVEAAINNVISGKNYFSQEIMAGLLKNINRRSQNIKSTELSDREIEVLYQICKGLSNQEIADNLCISKRTVDKHRENLLSKTNVKNTAGLVMYAIRNGIVEV